MKGSLQERGSQSVPWVLGPPLPPLLCDSGMRPSCLESSILDGGNSQVHPFLLKAPAIVQHCMCGST